ARVIGVATSVSQFARTMGSALGGGRIGAIMNNRLAHYLAQALPPGTANAGVSSAVLQGSPQQILTLPAPIRAAVVEGFAQSLHVVFLATVPFVVFGLVLTLFLKELPLRS